MLGFLAELCPPIANILFLMRTATKTNSIATKYELVRPCTNGGSSSTGDRIATSFLELQLLEHDVVKVGLDGEPAGSTAIDISAM